MTSKKYSHRDESKTHSVERQGTFKILGCDYWRVEAATLGFHRTQGSCPTDS